MVDSIQYVPMMAEWLAVPTWHRWATWMRAGEVGVKAFEIDPMPLDQFDGVHIPDTNLPEFTESLAKGIGHRYPPTFTVIPFGGTIGRYGIYNPLTDKLDFYLLAHLNTPSASASAEDAGYAKYYSQLEMRKTIVHEMKHRDGFHPFIATAKEGERFNEMMDRIEAHCHGAPKSFIKKQLLGWIRDHQKMFYRRSSWPWGNFSADAGRNFAQQILREALAQEEFLGIIGESDAYLTEHIYRAVSTRQQPFMEYDLYFNNQQCSPAVPKPLQNPDDLVRFFTSPTCRQIPARIAYALARSRVAISAFRCVELGGNLTAIFDALEMRQTLKDYEEGKKDGIALTLQGATTVTSLPASIIGTAGLFAVDKLRYLRIAGPLAMISGALAAGKRCYEIWQNEEASSKEKWWSVAEVASSIVSAGASIALGFRTPAVLPIYGAAAVAGTPLLLPALAMGGFVFSITAGFMQKE